MKRVKTHIQGFDELIQGGFPKGSVNLVSGEPGTGKTIFSLEFLYNGAIKEKEVGVYFTFEEKKESLFEQAKQFNWDLEKLEKKGLIKIISIGTLDISSNTIKDMLDIVKSTKAKRVVIDSLTTLSFITPDSIQTGTINQFTIKKFLYYFITTLTENTDLTSLCISQKDEGTSNAIAEYLCDGVILINPQKLGSSYNRNIGIKKMRKTKNDDDMYPMEISKEGIIVHNNK